MAMRQIVLGFCLSSQVALGGCGTPLLPELSPLKLTGASYDKLEEIDCLLPRNARVCALATAVELQDKLVQISRVDRIAELVLFGLGTAVGLTIAKDWGDSLLKDLGLAVGGLVGLNAVVDTDAQAAIYDKGLTATLCLIRGYDALAELDGNAITKALDEDVTNFAASVVAMNDLAAKNAIEQTALVSVEAVAQSQALAANGVRHLDLVAFNAMNSLVLFADDLQSAVRSRDADLSAAIIDLRMTISRRLSKVGDQDDLVGGQTDQMIQSMKGVVAKNKDFQEAKKAAVLAGQSTPETLIAAAGNESAVASLQQVIETAERVDSVLKDCLSAVDYASVFD